MSNPEILTLRGDRRDLFKFTRAATIGFIAALKTGSNAAQAARNTEAQPAQDENSGGSRENEYILPAAVIGSATCAAISPIYAPALSGKVDPTIIDYGLTAVAGAIFGGVFGAGVGALFSKSE